MSRKIMVEVTKEEFEKLEKGLDKTDVDINKLSVKDLAKELIKRYKESGLLRFEENLYMPFNDISAKIPLNDGETFYFKVVKGDI